MDSLDICARSLRNPHAAVGHVAGADCAHGLRRLPRTLHDLRETLANQPVLAGMSGACRSSIMADEEPDPANLIVLHVVMWTTLVAGFVMMLVVLLMRR
jgi:hypothetical protein